MRAATLETQLLGLLAQAPFLDRQEMAAISGGSPGRGLRGRPPAGGGRVGGLRSPRG